MKTKLLMSITIVILLLLSFQNFAQAPPLGTAADYVLFSTVGAVGNTGISQITGNVGTNSGEITGFGNVNGVMNESNGASGQCAADLLIAYNLLNASIPTFFPAPLLGNGQVLNAGIYEVSGASTLEMELTLDAQNDPNAVFIIRLKGPFSTGANSKVTLVNGALACNVFWKVEGLVDMASGTTMRGTVIANNAAINMNVGDTLEGRALSTAGAVNVSGVMAYSPVGCGSPVLMGPAAPDFVSAACYAIFSGNGPVSNAGISYATGDIGTNVGLTTGFNPLFVTGMIHPIPDGSTAAAASDLLNAYNYLNTLPYDIELLYPAQFGNNLVLTPHTYLLNAATSFTDTLFLDAGGQEDAVFVIQINGALSTSTYSKVILINGTKVENVFWKVDGAVNINDYSIFKGTIVANNGAVLLATGVNVEGRAFSTTGAIGTTAVTVTMPLGCATVSAPEVITAPENQTACEDGMVSFSVSATGTDIEYQWRRGTENLIDGTNIFGSTTETLTINPVTFSDAASDYNVVVTGFYAPAATSENVSLFVQTLPTNVFAGDDETVCETCPLTLSAATAENFSSLLWTTTGDGSFDDEADLNATYTPGINDPGTFVTLCLHLEQIAPCDGLAYVDCMDLFVESVILEPVANAGEDQDICENQVAHLVGQAENYSNLMWSGGDGIFSAPISLVTDYTPGPGDILAGTVELCLTAELIVPSTVSDEDCLTLTLSALPANVFAGNDATVCETCPLTLSAATAENYSSLLWTTTGDGAFDNETDLNATYTPGITDPGTIVTLCLNAEQIAPCDGLAYVDCMDLFVESEQLEPIANAGNDQSICEGQLANLVGDAQNYNEVTWTGGDGVFSDPNSLITDYTPGAGDILAGSVDLCLTAEVIIPNPISDEDCLTLTLSALPANVFAGNDATVCETCPLTLSGATAENFSSLLWTTTGDGAFDNETYLNATYTPGVTDPGTIVTLCLNAEQIAPCDGLAYVDCMDLFVESEQLEPIANAGNDQSICEGQLANLVGDAQNYDEVMWIGGDGVFSSPNSLITNYTPGAGDILAGSVDLCLTAEIFNPNYTTDVDCMTLSIFSSATVNTGYDMTVCDNILNSPNPFVMISATASNYNGFEWSGGNGFFDPDFELVTNYYPDQSDLDAGSVTLCLTANPVSPCLVGATDCMTLYFDPSPTVYAGTDASVCVGIAYELADAEATNFSLLEWATSGDGFFDNPALLNPVYTPGFLDITNGSAILSLLAQPQGIVCSTPATDNMVLVIISQPVVDLGSELDLDCGNFDFTAGEWMPLVLDPIIENYNTVEWTTSGDGSFSPSTTSVDAVYNLGVNDIWGGEVILCLTVYGNVSCGYQVSDCVMIKVPQQLIPFNLNTWWGVSSYLSTNEVSVPGVMEPVVGSGPGSTNLVMMIDKIGRYYWPESNQQVNQIGNWSPVGYKAKFKNTSPFPNPTCLPIYGEMLTDQSFTVNGAYTYLPVLTNVKTPIADLFAGHFGDIYLIYDWAYNRLWTPAASDFTDLQPGRAYMVVNKNAGLSYTVEFPDYDQNAFATVEDGPGKDAINNSPWNDVVNTSQPHFILFTEQATAGLLAGDIIGTFSPDGLCFGYAEYAGKESSFNLIAMGNDSGTDGYDGYASGDFMNFSVYRPETGATYNIDLTYDHSFPNYDGTFVLNGVSNVIKTTMTLTATNDLNVNPEINVFPNPAKDAINITSSANIMWLRVINMTGQLVIDKPANGTNTQCDISELVKGLYFLQIETIDGTVLTKRIVIE